MKKWFESKTVGVNLLTGIVGAASLPTLESVGVQPQWLVVSLAIANIVLRIFFTSKPIR